MRCRHDLDGPTGGRIAGPLVGGLLIHAFGVHAVYLVASTLTFFGAWIVGRELRVRVPAPALSPRA